MCRENLEEEYKEMAELILSRRNFPGLRNDRVTKITYRKQADNAL